MEASSRDREDLENLEEGLWRAETRFDPEWMERVLSSDFFEFGRSGRVHGRHECLEVDRQPINSRLPLKDLRIRLITRDVAQVIYVSAVTYNGEVEYGNRSSIWIRNEHGWQLVFHQGTAI